MKKRKPKPPMLVTRNVPLLAGRFALCVADRLVDAETLTCKKFLKRVPQGALDGWRGGCVRHKGRFGVILDRNYLTHGVLAHEVYHSISMILEHSGVDADHRNDETGAYLCDELTAWIYQKLQKAGERVRGGGI